MDVAAFLDRIRSQPISTPGRSSTSRSLPERPGRFAEPAEPLPPALRRIARRARHRAALLAPGRGARAGPRGRDLVVVTGTASGKTLCYNLPILETVLADPDARALYLFPTKALAQDQHKGLLELLRRQRRGDAIGCEPGVFDGDTPTAQRRRIQAEAHLVLSNPDMLHASILPYHPKWSRFFSDLRYVVIDEVHTYRGILGANVACVLRRLVRVCEHYGSRPVFLAASATIANPGELAGKLLGRDVAVVDGDGAPRGRSTLRCGIPAPLGEDRLARRSATDDAVLLMVEAMLAGGQALAFTRTRQAAELVHRYVAGAARGAALEAGRPGARLSRRLPAERAARDRSSNCSAASCAAWRPPTRWSWASTSVRSTWRCWSAIPARSPAPGSRPAAAAGGTTRAWRCCWPATIRSISTCARHPEYFFAQSPEHAVVDPENPYVLANHLQAAAFELPLDEADVERFGPLGDADRRRAVRRRRS